MDRSGPGQSRAEASLARFNRAAQKKKAAKKITISCSAASAIRLERERNHHFKNQHETKLTSANSPEQKKRRHEHEIQIPNVTCCNHVFRRAGIAFCRAGQANSQSGGGYCENSG